jgi:hypothetical protein
VSAGAATVQAGAARAWRTAALVAGWLCVVGVGMGAVWKYGSTPGAPAQPPVVWPAESRLPAPQGTPALVMLVHPRCPCSRASLGKLAELMTRLRGRLRAHVLFLKPAGTAKGWEDADTWRRAHELEGVTPLIDEGGVEAARFGASTSGETLLYAADGRQLFHGGVTAARGHLGDSAGFERIVAWVEAGGAARGDAPVFGCALADPQEGVPDGAL